MGSALSITPNTSTGFRCKVFSETELLILRLLSNSALPIEGKAGAVTPRSALPSITWAKSKGVYAPQVAVVVNLLHVPGVPERVHKKSVASLSRYISPVKWKPLVGLPVVVAKSSLNGAMPPLNRAP
jgi:hypothetical protein